MNRYLSSERWKREGRGIYTSPCGRFTAFREAHARWKLVRGSQAFGPYFSLADCQEIAARKGRSVL